MPRTLGHCAGGQRGGGTVVDRSVAAHGRAGSAAAGGSLIQLSPSTAVLLGGGLVSTDPFAEIFFGLNNGLAVASPAPAVAGAVMTEFQTATPLGEPTGGSGQILLTGGFAVDSAGGCAARRMASEAVRIITANVNGSVTTSAAAFGGGYVADTACASSARYPPGRLGVERGRHPRSRAGHRRRTDGGPGACNDCPSGANSLLCALPQASLFTPLLHHGRAGGAPPDRQLGRPHVDRAARTATCWWSGASRRCRRPTPAGSPPKRRDLRPAPRWSLPVDITLTSPVDADDPIASDLAADMLLRVPGGQACRSSVEWRPAPPALCSNL